MRKVRIAVLGLVGLLFWATTVHAIRVKDIASIKGVRGNMLVGYGLVVGLGGTGDDDKTTFTFQTVANMLEKMGIVVESNDVDLDNVAAVMVTASLPPFAKVGTRIDVTVSSLGNASSLAGGTLLMTELEAPNGKVYAVAQGPVSIGGFEIAGASGSNIQKNHVLAGLIPSGATVEQEVPLELNGKKYLEVLLNSPDFTTSMRIAQTISGVLAGSRAEAIDGGTVLVNIPEAQQSNVVRFIYEIENIEVMPDSIARVILNERTGTVVMGEHVRLSTVAVSHGNLSIIVKEQPTVSQPLPFSRGRTEVVQQTEIAVEEEKSNLIIVPSGANIGDVVRGLNAIGVTPRDLISIMQAIKASGALHADIHII